MTHHSLTGILGDISMIEAGPQEAYEAVICVPTFRRPAHLEKTLASLVNQAGDIRFAVVVVDNDAKIPAGKAVADAVFSSGVLRGISVVEDRQGNCYAINRAFSTARETYKQAEFFLMIDDDEVADPAWLQRMVAAAKDNDADLVGGPVVRIFDGKPAVWVVRHPLFGTYSAPTGPIATLFGSGNCLIRRRVFDTLDDPDFDLRFNFLGGGDMDFFTRCRLRGLRAYWNSEAIAIETVPASRMDMVWVLRRGFTTGVINYTIDRKRRPGAIGFTIVLAKNVISLGLSVGRAARVFWETRHWLPASFPICVSIGRTLGVFGFAPAPYKA
jgi:glycosyltransferase involved in cell wall biosynthesis